MKQVQRFVCEYCGHSYKTEEECKSCESVHKINPKFNELRYVPAYKDKVGFPHTMELEFADGSKAVYKFATTLDKINEKK